MTDFSPLLTAFDTFARNSGMFAEESSVNIVFYQKGSGEVHIKLNGGLWVLGEGLDSDLHSAFLTAFEKHARETYPGAIGAIVYEWWYK